MTSFYDLLFAAVGIRDLTQYKGSAHELLEKISAHIGTDVVENLTEEEIPI